VHNFFSNQPPKRANRIVSNLMPSNTTLTRSNSEPSLSSQTSLADLPPMNASGKNKPLDNDHPNLPNKTLKDLVFRGKITAKDAISMGEAAKNILESRTTVGLARKNCDKAIWASFDKGTTVLSSITESGIEEKLIGCTEGLQSKNLHPLIREKLQSSIAQFGIGKESVGCPSKFQSGNLHPLIREKLERIVLLANGASCA